LPLEIIPTLESTDIADMFSALRFKLDRKLSDWLVNISAAGHPDGVQFVKLGKGYSFDYGAGTIFIRQRYSELFAEIWKRAYR
jgi:hypothetical protein